MGKVAYDFSGERFVVTGASAGMGRVITEELAAAGAIMLAIARRRDKLSKLECAYSGHIVPLAVDVCDSQGMSAGVASFVAEYGKLNGAVHAAGIFSSTPLRAYDENEARRVMDVSFWAGIRLMQLVNKKKNSAEAHSTEFFDV